MLAITDFMLPLIHRKMCNVPVNRNYGARSEQRLLFHHTATMMPREGERERENGEENVVSFAIVLEIVGKVVANGNSEGYRSEVGSSGMAVDGRGCSPFFFSSNRVLLVRVIGIVPDGICRRVG